MPDPNQNLPDPFHDEPGPRGPKLISLMLLSLLAGTLTLLAMCYPYQLRDPETEGVTWLALTDRTAFDLFWLMLLFVPYGFVECWVGVNLFRQGWLVTLVVAMDAAILALVGESAQLWIQGQSSSMIDLVAHVIGALLGSLFAFVMVDWWWQGKPSHKNSHHDGDNNEEDNSEISN